MAYQLSGSAGVLIKTENETNDIYWFDELDHVPFSRRRKLLESRKLNSFSAHNESAFPLNVAKEEDEQCDSQGLYPLPSVVSPISEEIDQERVQLQSCEAKVSLGIGAVDEHLQNATACNELVEPEDCDSHKPNMDKNFCSDQMSLERSNGADVQTELQSNIPNDFVDDLDHIVLKERHGMLLRKMRGQPIPEGKPLGLSSCGTLDTVSPSTNSMSSSILPNLVKVKAEPLDNNTLPDLGKDAIGTFFKMAPVKGELNFTDELGGDKVDNLRLRDRMHLQTWEGSELNTRENSECLRKVLSSGDNGHASDPIKINRPRKRRTATDSIETALEEDAPGLLQVLVEQGVSVDEIKLYGESDNDEAIDESLVEDGFAYLEVPVSKTSFQKDSLLKLAPLRRTKGSKPSYYLICLFSLVEQTRYLQFRNWPAEWGWCRDLLSFIFVFERHNRIVLERPEYGYATYFFGLVDSVPIDWQIKRLVTAMKLTNCGRITLIENKTLLVGEDLTEGEAKVLMQYGWTPNSGLGTMLNYCDRVVHDRKSEKESSEWRSKIGKMLMDGYNGGSIVSSCIQEPPVESEVDHTPQIKLEL